MTIVDLYAMFGEATIQAELANQRVQTLRSQILEHIQQQKIIEVQKEAEAAGEAAKKAAGKAQKAAKKAAADSNAS